MDIGCSSGGFGALVKRKLGIEVWGIEPFEAAVIKASERLDHVIHGVFPDGVDLESEKFTCITFNDVLEHMADPWTALKVAKNHLTSDGVVVASLPNIQCYSVIRDLIIEQDFKYEESGILDKTHLRFFTKKSICRLLEESGYDVLRIVGFGSIRTYSRLLKIASFFSKKRTENFSYTAFALVAKPKFDKG